MECVERDHLKDVIRIAIHELTWALHEESRLAFSGDRSGTYRITGRRVPAQ
jgi:hypothetical protein